MAVRFQAGMAFFFFLRRRVFDCFRGRGLGAGGFGGESGSVGGCCIWSGLEVSLGFRAEDITGSAGCCASRRDLPMD
ncbi:MAG: hypothetical protein PHT19_06710 [Methylococcus sp.]|nr:hypothetical protein [Methylococcus sp.]